MIVFTATLWPGGQATESKELLHATISNTSSSAETTVDSYTAHVTARPNRFMGVEGFDADVEVTEHVRADGIVPLIVSVLDAARCKQDQIYPPHRTLQRLSLREVHEFDEILKGRR